MKVIIFANTEWYLYNFRRSFALALQKEGFEVLLISPPGPYGEKLRDLGLRWESLPMDRRSLNPFHELRLFWHLWRLFKREQPDLVHGFTVKCAVYGGLASRLAGVPAWVSAVAGIGYVFTSDDVKARLLRPLVRILLRVALDSDHSRLILQNPDDVALFKDTKLVHPSRIRLIRGSGVDCTRFKERDPSVDITHPMRVLLAARLLWDKGVGEYHQAAKLLKEQSRDIEFLLAGDPDPGNPDAIPEQTVRAWEAQGSLRWLGHVDDMPALMGSVDMFVLPTYYGEGLPKSLIEAAVCALPLITTDSPGCREVVTHEVDGLLVKSRDASALAEAIARLNDDPGMARRLGQAARAKALREFDERIVIERTIDVYRELLPLAG